MIDLNEKPLCTIPRVMCWVVDNLELLKSQPDESVDLIYSDILYGTGRNFGEYQDLKPKQDVIESHYLPRLVEMKRVLKQNGSIYLQMDTRINHWMRILMDKVFGYDNFQNEIIWHYTSGGASKNKFSSKHDSILFYSKTSNYKFNPQKYRRYIDKSLGYNPNVEYFFDKEKQSEYTLNNMTDVWTDIGIISTNAFERVGYPTQKPQGLVERIIKASSNEGDVVADYYLGSGTTAEVCKELNRNFIGCDINPKAIELTKTRLNAGT